MLHFMLRLQSFKKKRSKRWSGIRPQPSGRAGKGGQGGGKASGKASGDQWRSHPYADNKGSGSKGSGKASGKGSSSSYESAEIDQLTLQLANQAQAAGIREQLVAAAARCEAATRAASRMARQAWMASEEEANGLLSLINDLRATGDPIRF